MKTIQRAFAGLFISFATVTAHAGSVDAVSLLNDYNLILSGSVVSYSEVEGNALIRGDVTSGLYNMHQTSNANVPALTVGGNVYGYVQTKGKGLNIGGNLAGNATVNDGGDAYIGSVSGSFTNNANGHGSTNVIGDISGSVHTNGGNTTYSGNATGYVGANGSGKVLQQPVSSPVDAKAQANSAISTLSQFSNELANVQSNSDFTTNGSKVTFNAVGDASGLAVFTISNALNFFSQAFEFDFTFNNVTSVLFNVFGGSDDVLNVNTNFLASAATKWGSMFLWNFVDATSLNLNSQFGGSILALNADVTNRNNIEGTLVANNLTQYGEIHSQPTSFVPPAAVPIPAAFPLLLSGLIGLFSMMRYNRRKLTQ